MVYLSIVLISYLRTAVKETLTLDNVGTIYLGIINNSLIKAQNFSIDKLKIFLNNEQSPCCVLCGRNLETMHLE